MCLGTIYKLHRIEYGLTLSEVAPLIGVSLSKLSDFENNKTQLPLETIYKLYSFIEIDAKFPDDNEKVIDQSFKDLYNSILKLNGKSEFCYSQFFNIRDYIYCTSSYIIWILGKFVYHTYFPTVDLYDYQVLIKTLSDHLELLPSVFRQIYYDTLGIYHKDKHELKEAEFYFDRALQELGTTQTLAMVYYHKSMVLNQLGGLTDSLACVVKAKKLFDQDLNLKRSIMANVSLGVVNVRLGNYLRGEKAYFQCLEAMGFVEFDNVIIVYNNLVWSYILSEQYEKAIEYSMKALNIDKEFPYIYFYLSYASWKINDRKAAIHYIQDATIIRNQCDPYGNAIIQAFSIYINKKLSISKTEKMFLVAYKEAKKLNDYQLQIFVYELIVDLYVENNNEKKIFEYKNKLLDLYKRRN